MKKNIYDRLSATAVAILVISTILTQHSSRWGYLFGGFVILAAVGSFALYIFALRKQSSSPQTDTTTDNLRVSVNNAVAGIVSRLEEQVVAPKEAGLDAIQKINLPRRLEYYALLSTRLRSEDVDWLEGGASNRYAMQIKFHREPTHDPAFIITNVIEKLCTATIEPRFEFTLSPNGTFTIRQIPTKHAASKDSVVATSTTPKDLGPIN